MDSENRPASVLKSTLSRRHSVEPSRGILKQRNNEEKNHTVHIMSNLKSAVEDEGEEDTMTKRRRVSFAPDVTLHKIHIEPGSSSSSENLFSGREKSIIMPPPNSTFNHRNPLRVDIKNIHSHNASSLIFNDEIVDRGHFSIYEDKVVVDEEDQQEDVSMELTNDQKKEVAELFGGEESDEIYEEETMDLTGPLKSLNAGPGGPFLYLPGGKLSLTSGGERDVQQITIEQNNHNLDEEEAEDKEDMTFTEHIRSVKAKSLILTINKDIEESRQLEEEEEESDEEEEMESTQKITFLRKKAPEDGIGFSTVNSTESKNEERESTQRVSLVQNLLQEKHIEKENPEDEMENTERIYLLQNQSLVQPSNMSVIQEVTEEESMDITNAASSLVVSQATEDEIPMDLTGAIQSMQSQEPLSQNEMPMELTQPTKLSLPEFEAEAATAEDPDVLNKSNISTTGAEGHPTSANENARGAYSSDPGFVGTYTETTTIPLSVAPNSDSEDEYEEQIYTLSQFLEEAKISFNDSIEPDRSTKLDAYMKSSVNAPISLEDYIVGIQEVPRVKYYAHAIKEYERGLKDVQLNLEAFETHMRTENPLVVQELFEANSLLKESLRNNFRILKDRSKILSSLEINSHVLRWLEALSKDIASENQIVQEEIDEAKSARQEVNRNCDRLQNRKEDLQARIEKLKKHQNRVMATDKSQVELARRQLVNTIDKVLEAKEDDSASHQSNAILDGSILLAERKRDEFHQLARKMLFEIHKNQPPTDEQLRMLHRQFAILEDLSDIKLLSFSDKILKVAIANQSLIISYDFEKSGSEGIKLEFNTALTGNIIDLTKQELHNMVKDFSTPQELFLRLQKIWGSAIKLQKNIKTLELYYRIKTSELPKGVKIDIELFKHELGGYHAIFSFVVDIRAISDIDSPIFAFAEVEKFSSGHQVTKDEAMDILKEEHKNMVVVNRLHLSFTD